MSPYFNIKTMDGGFLSREQSYGFMKKLKESYSNQCQWDNILFDVFMEGILTDEEESLSLKSEAFKNNYMQIIGEKYEDTPKWVYEEVSIVNQAMYIAIYMLQDFQDSDSESHASDCECSDCEHEGDCNCYDCNHGDGDDCTCDACDVNREIIL